MERCAVIERSGCLRMSANAADDEVGSDWGLECLASPIAPPNCAQAWLLIDKAGPVWWGKRWIRSSLQCTGQRGRVTLSFEVMQGDAAYLAPFGLLFRCLPTFEYRIASLKE